MYPREQAGLVVNLPGDLVEADNELRDLEAQGKATGKRIDELKNRIRAAIGEAEVGYLPNGVAWSWKAREVKGYTVEARVDRVLKRKDPK